MILFEVLERSQTNLKGNLSSEIKFLTTKYTEQFYMQILRSKKMIAVAVVQSII